MTHSPDHAERAREAARDIRNTMQRSLRSGHRQAHMNYGPLTVCLDQIDAALRGCGRVVEEQRTEILRLRGLLIDPGDPAWDDARAVLVAELRKAEMPNHARAVADGAGAYIPSRMALNLIAHATRAALHDAKEAAGSCPYTTAPRREGDEWACRCGKRWPVGEEHP